MESSIRSDATTCLFDAMDGSRHQHRSVPISSSSRAAAKYESGPHIRKTECRGLAINDRIGHPGPTGSMHPIADMGELAKAAVFFAVALEQWPTPAGLPSKAGHVRLPSW